MNRLWVRSIAAVALTLLSADAARAAYTLAFDQAAYEVVPGAAVNVKLMLVNTSPSPSGVLEAEGLQSAGGRVLNDGGDAFVSLSSITVAAGFSATSSTFYPPTAFPVADPNNLAGVLANNDSFTTGVGVGQDAVTIATFQFTVTGNVGDVALLSPAELRVGNSFAENISFDTGTSLDAQLDGAYSQATITVTPEPCGVALFSAGVIAGLKRRRR